MNRDLQLKTSGVVETPKPMPESSGRVDDIYLVPGTPVLDLGQFELNDSGCSVEEWFLHGTAVAYAVDDRREDGQWNAFVEDSAPFTTRLVVCKPTERARANGVVVLDWLNVSGGIDSCAEWRYLHREIIRKGMTYVGLSAQQAGISGGGIVPGSPLQQIDPERYGRLDHPGDQFSYDIFTQAARALRSPDGPLQGRTTNALLATGSSQSAAYLVSYLNAAHPLNNVIDGFLLDGRGDTGAPMSGPYLTAAAFASIGGRRPVNEKHRIREDMQTPTMVVQTETDVINRGSWSARQDSLLIRTWEIAGAAHFDTYGLVAANEDDGSLEPSHFASLLVPSSGVLGSMTQIAINSGPQHHYVLQAALSGLVGWVLENRPAAPSVFLEIDDDPIPDLLRDEAGIAKGGVRTPWMDVPIQVLSGLGQEGPGFVGLFGTTKPLRLELISNLYTGGQTEYLQRFETATDESVRAGYLLSDDAAEIKTLSVEAPWPQ